MEEPKFVHCSGLHAQKVQCFCATYKGGHRRSFPSEGSGIPLDPYCHYSDPPYATTYFWGQKGLDKPRGVH
ncbi:hypothetical protein AMTR_s00062p00133820 [Amborella trichopoda]|uniref:Uncharacterized protein n=1 Tax=Amborella trichopoda TaxID=13333 RepID=U5DGR8_AMBTC|nr:hypothetical protein AMTR_s00062p00133820 [Amborella trichopoda]